MSEELRKEDNPRRPKVTFVSREYHGMRHTSEYRSWRMMKNRCCNPKAKDFHHYGGRGIKVCNRWQRSFKAFLEDMGAKPSIKHSVERIDNNKGYSKQNCKWATYAQQSLNKRGIVFVEFNGERLCVSHWEKRFGFAKGTIASRIRVSGWSIERALTTPTKTKPITLPTDKQ
jgi:hypothetical protein